MILVVKLRRRSPWLSNALCSAAISKVLWAPQESFFYLRGSGPEYRANQSLPWKLEIYLRPRTRFKLKTKGSWISTVHLYRKRELYPKWNISGLLNFAGANEMHFGTLACIGLSRPGFFKIFSSFGHFDTPFRYHTMDSYTVWWYEYEHEEFKCVDQMAARVGHYQTTST